MSDKIFDLEQNIMNCWSVVDDVKIVTEHFVDSPAWAGMDPKVCDALMNKYFGIAELYQVKFEKLWSDFEAVSKEYHHYRLSHEDQD